MFRVIAEAELRAAGDDAEWYESNATTAKDAAREAASKRWYEWWYDVPPGEPLPDTYQVVVEDPWGDRTHFRVRMIPFDVMPKAL